MTPNTDRVTETVTFDWEGIALSVSYEPHWLGGDHTAHLEIRTIPRKIRLPFTETGYRSHFLPIGTIEAAGGVEAYVREWLDFMAQSREWKRYEQESRQYTLF